MKAELEVLCSNPTGGVVPPQLLSTSISVPGDDECVVTVDWSDPVISCGGSVPKYVLSVTLPTPDYQPGSGDSEFRTNETRYNLTVSVDVTYTLTVRANDICGNSRTGQPVNITPRSMLYIHYIAVAHNKHINWPELYIYKISLNVEGCRKWQCQNQTNKYCSKTGDDDITTMHALKCRTLGAMSSYHRPCLEA